MKDESNKLQHAAITAVWIAAVWAFFRWLLVPLLPFLLALGLSALLEPWVQRLRRTLHLRRSFAAAALITALLVVVGSAVMILFSCLGTELAAWSAQLPDAIDSFPGIWNNALDRVEGWYVSSPPFIRSALDVLAETLKENTTAFAGKAGVFLMDKASLLAARLPGISLFCITTILALYFTAAAYEGILAFLKRQLPRSWQKRCRAAVRCCRTTMLTWIRSELLLIAVTFAILLIGFKWIGLPYALLTASIVALVDAFPVLGTGTILLPWAVFSFLLGETEQGIALIALYAVALLVHSLLEPRLLASQTNLPPVAVLLAMYTGYHLLGVGGMILLPLALLLAKHLQDADVIRLWR